MFAAASFSTASFSPAAFLFDGLPALDPNGNRPLKEYQPTYHELRNLRAIEREFEDAQISLRITDSKIESLEFKRLHDLADQAMQAELLGLLAQQNELMQLLEKLQKERLRVLRDDEEIVAILMCLN